MAVEKARQLARACSRTAIPFTDADSTRVVDDAVRSLLARRGPSEADDAAAMLAVLVSIVVEADSRLPDAVADARDQGCTWEQIAMRMAMTVPAVRHRYAGYARWRRGVPLED